MSSVALLIELPVTVHAGTLIPQLLHPLSSCWPPALGLQLVC